MGLLEAAAAATTTAMVMAMVGDGGGVLMFKSNSHTPVSSIDWNGCPFSRSLSALSDSRKSCICGIDTSRSIDDNQRKQNHQPIKWTLQNGLRWTAILIKRCWARSGVTSRPMASAAILENHFRYLNSVFSSLFFCDSNLKACAITLAVYKWAIVHCNRLQIGAHWNFDVIFVVPCGVEWGGRAFALCSVSMQWPFYGDVQQ